LGMALRVVLEKEVVSFPIKKTTFHFTPFTPTAVTIIINLTDGRRSRQLNSQWGFLDEYRMFILAITPP